MFYVANKRIFIISSLLIKTPFKPSDKLWSAAGEMLIKKLGSLWSKIISNTNGVSSKNRATYTIQIVSLARYVCTRLILNF